MTGVLLRRSARTIPVYLLRRSRLTLTAPRSGSRLALSPPTLSALCSRRSTCSNGCGWRAQHERVAALHCAEPCGESGCCHGHGGPGGAGADLGAACCAGGHGEGHRPSGPDRQGDPHSGPFLRTADGAEGFRRYRRLKGCRPAGRRPFSSE